MEEAILEAKKHGSKKITAAEIHKASKVNSYLCRKLTFHNLLMCHAEEPHEIQVLRIDGSLGV